MVECERFLLAICIIVSHNKNGNDSVQRVYGEISGLLT